MQLIPNQSPSIAQWKRNAQDWHERDSTMFGDLLKSVRERMVGFS